MSKSPILGKTFTLACLLFYLLSTGLSPLAATPPEVLEKSVATCAWDYGFHSAGPSGTVLDSVTFDDGTGPALYIVGGFESVDDVVSSYIAKWDGSSWTSIGELDGNSFSVGVYDDGAGPKLVVSGNFQNADGTPANRIAQWDGSSWSALGSGLSNSAKALTVFNDGNGDKLIAGGFFNTAGGSPASRVAQWDGSSWSPLGSGVGPGGVESLIVFDDGGGDALFAAGGFTSAGGQSASRIAKWDGSTWSALGQGLQGSPAAMAAFNDGGGLKLYVGGSLTEAGGLPVSHIAGWDGSTWSALGQGLNAPVEALTVFNDGDGAMLAVGGRFTEAGGIPAHYAAQWDGAVWSSFATNLDIGIDHRIWTLTPFDSGSGPRLYAGGFLEIPGTGRHLVSWNGSSWNPVTSASGAGFDDEAVYAFTIHDDGSGPDLYAGGSFRSAAGNLLEGVAQWNGSGWVPLGSGFDGYVFALASWDDGNGPVLYAGGEFTMAGGVAASRIAKWDGTSWTALGPGVGSMVLALLPWDDGSGEKLYAGGEFDTAGGIATSFLAGWDGTSWLTFPEGPEGFVHSLLAHNDGSGDKLYVGGDFYEVDGIVSENVARWDGTNWEALGTGVQWYVRSMSVHDDGSGPELYAGGLIEFGRENPSELGDQCCVGKWDGSSWTAIDFSTSNAVHALAGYDPGGGSTLYAGGFFFDLGTQGATHIAGWNGSWNPMEQGGISETGTVYALQAFDDGSGEALYVGGFFSTAGDTASSHVARYSCPPVPQLGLEDGVPAIVGQTIDVPIGLSHFGTALVGTSFSIDYDQTCLSFSETDVNADNIPDAVTYLGPAGYTLEVTVDSADPDGEIDISLYDAFPTSTLGDGPLFNIQFETICTPAVGTFETAEVLFSTDPEPSFTNDLTQDVNGSWTDGSVTVFNGLRGDCNSSGVVSNGDLVANQLEIFDGDGTLWSDVPGGTFAGDAAGCDANADETVDAGDLSCIHRLIFGSACASSLQTPTAETGTPVNPSLVLGPWEVPVQNERATVELTVKSPNHDINSLAASLDLDTTRYTLDATDTDSDGIPDSVGLPADSPSRVDVRWEPSDSDGELDLVLSQPGLDASAAFPDELVIEIEVILLDPLDSPGYVTQPFRFSQEPAASFGDVDGRRQAGDALVPVVGLFEDGFESGNSASWALTVP